MRKILGYVCLVAGGASLAGAFLAFGMQRDNEIAPYVPLYAALLLLSATTLVASIGALTHAARSPIGAPMRPITWKWLAAGAAGVVTTVWCSIALLMFLANQAPDSNERTKLKFDALKTSLTVGAGAAGVVALVLAFRRQWLTERAQLHLEFDASEQRVTNLYTKAADQLGHDNAAVRLAGLYALERVAQNNPEHRQTIVDVLCAYLRMPLPRNPRSTTEAEAYEDGRESPAEFVEASRRYDQELNVRDAAQTIITKHLRLEDDASQRLGYFWPDLDLDLRGAHLRNFALDGCRLRGADFGEAVFRGGILVARTIFDGVPWGTHGPVGVGGVQFASCEFRGRVVFEDVDFLGDASFNKADFRRDTFFGGVDFASEADFESAKFRASTAFESVGFRKGARFEDAAFSGDVSFSAGAIYVKGSQFENGEANFSGALFDGSVDFAGATFTGRPISSGSASNGTNFERARVRVDEDLSQVWPDGWRNGDDVEPGYVVLVQNAISTAQ